MGVSKEFLDSLSSGTVDPQTGIQGEVKSNKVKSNLSADEIDAVIKNPIPDSTVGRGTLDIDYTKFKNYGGLPVDTDVQEYRAMNQSVGEQAAFGLGRLVGTTATKFLTGLGYIGSAVPAIVQGDINVMLDNAWSETLTNLEEDIKQELLPIHHRKKYLEGNILNQMGTFGFWADDVIDGASFLASAAIGAGGISKLGSAVGAYGKLARVFSRTLRAAKLGKVGQSSAALSKTAKALDFATVNLFNSTTEAAFEAKEVKDRVYESLMKEVESGRMTEEEARSKASMAARNTFGWNIAALMPSNAVTNAMLFKKFDFLSSKLGGIAGLGKEVKPLSFAKKAGIFGKEALLSMASEGAYEENIQLAVSDYFNDVVTGFDNPNFGDDVAGVIKNMVNNFSTDEGQKNIVLGSIIGMIPGGVGGLRGAKETNRKQMALQSTFRNFMNSDKESMLSYYKRQPQTDPDTGEVVKDERGNIQYTNNIVTKEGKPVIDKERIQQEFMNMYSNYADFAASLKASNSGSKAVFDYIRNKHIARIASGFYHLDGGIDSFDEWVDSRAAEEVEELTKLGDEVDNQTVEEIRDRYKAVGRRYFNYLRQIDNNFAGLVDLPNTEEGNAFRQNLKGEEYFRAVEQDFWRDQLVEYTNALEEAQNSGDTKQVNNLTKRVEEITNILNESEAAAKEAFDIEFQKRKFEGEQEEIKEAQEGKGAVDSDLKDDTNEVTPEQENETTQTEEQIFKPEQTETVTKQVKKPKHVIETSSNDFARATKFTENTASSNNYVVDETTLNPDLDVRTEDRAMLSNDFGNVKSTNSSNLELLFNTRNTEKGPVTNINFSETTPEGRVAYKSYDTFEDLNEELEIEEDAVDHGFKNFNIQPGSFKLHNVEYGEDTAKATVDKNGTEYTIPIKNKNVKAVETRSDKPSVFYKKDEVNKTLHSVVTDAQDNIVRDTYTKQKTFYNQAGTPTEVAFNFTNGKLTSIRAKDTFTKEVFPLALPELAYEIENLDTLLKDFETGTEYSSVLPSEEDQISLETVQSVSDIKQELRSEKEALAEEIRNSIKAKAEAYAASIGVTDKTTARQEKQAEFNRKVADSRYLRWVYGSDKMSNTTMTTVFEDGSIKYIPSIYLDKVGYLERDGNDIVFKEVVEGKEEVTEYLIGTVNNTDTFADNGVTILNQTPFEFEILENGASYNIQGEYYTNNFEDTADAIEYDADGIVSSITLWNSEGDKVRLTNPFVVNNIAYAIEVQEAVEDKIFKDYFKQGDDFVIFSHASKNYAVYRKPDGKYSIVDVVTERPVRGKLHANIREAFTTELHNTINELAYNKISENNKTKKEVRDEVRSISQAIRSATAREASKLPDESEVASPKEGKAETQRSRKEEQLEKQLEDIVSEEAALNEQAEEEQEKQIEEAEKQEYKETASEISGGIETLEAEDYSDRGPLKMAMHGIKHAASGISYVWRNRQEGEYVVNNLDAHDKMIKTPVEGMSFRPQIDFNNETFWPEHQELKARLQSGKLTDNEIAELLEVKEDNFNNPVDAIPVKLVADVSGETFENGIYLHATAYDKITPPANIFSIKDEAERNKAYEKFIRQEQMITRNTRKQILTKLLKGEYVEIPALNKSIGTPNNVGRNQNLGDVLRKVNPKVDLKSVTLGVGVRKDTIYKNGEEIVDVVANAQKGNIFLETNYTANGKPAVVKLNPAKLSRQHAAIVFKAFKQAYSKGKGGFAGKYIGDEVQGNLSRLDVLNLLVYYGEDNTKVNPKDKRKKHLRSKQLWVERASILHFGDQKVSLHKATNEEVKKFIDWATKNKNYTINRTMLGSKITGKGDFKIGNFEYSKESDNYTSFVIKNGLIQTDVDQVSDTKSLFKQPGIAMDLEASGIEKGAGTVTEKQLKSYAGQRQIPLDDEQSKEAQEATARVEEQVPEAEPVEDNNPEVAEAAYDQTLVPLKTVAGIETLPAGTSVYIPIKENGQINKYPIGVVKKGKSGKIGFSKTLNFDHPIANYIKPKLANVTAFAFDNTEALNNFKSAIRGEENNIYFDSPAKPKEEVANKPEPKPEVTETPKETYEDKPVEDQIEDTQGKKTSEDLPDTGDIFLDDIGFNPFNREVSWAENQFTRVDIQKELKRLKKRLKSNRGGSNIPVEVVDRLIKISTNRHAFAQFYADGFRLSRLAEEGSILHEIFHRVSLGYLTESERQSIYKEARDKYSSQLKETYNKEEFTDREVEEFLAEQYRDYALMKEESPSTEPKLGIPQRIVKFFKNLWNFLRTWFTGRTRLDSYDISTLFSAIEDGKFKYARISKENLSQLKGDIYNFEVKGKEIESIQSPEEFREVIHNLFYMLAESNRLIETDENTGRVAVRISDYNDVSKIKFGNLYRAVERDRARYNSAANNSDSLIKSIKEGTIKKEQLLNIKKKLGSTSMSNSEVINRLTKNSDVSARLFNIFDDVYKNFDTFKEAVEDYMASMNIQRVTDNSDIETTDVDEETGDTIDDFDRYNKTSYEVSAKENTALSIKFLISMLPKEVGRNATTGLYSFVDFSPTWSRLINDLLGSRDIEDMIDRLEKRSTDNPSYQVLIRKLKEDENLKTQFYTTMQKYKHDFVNMLVTAENAETLDYRIVNAAIQQAATRYAKEWGSDFFNDKGLFKVEKGKQKVGDVEFYEDLIEEFNTLTSSARRDLNRDGVLNDLDARINKLIELLNAIDIKVDSQSIRNSLFEIGGITESHSFVELLTKKIPYLFNENSSIYKVLNGEVLRGPQDNKVAPENVFLYEQGALFLADAYAKTRPFDLGDTVYGPQGNRYYTIAQNTYMSDLIRELHNDPSNFVEQRSLALYNGNSKFLETLTDPEKAKKVKLLTMSAFLREDQYDTGREYQGITDLEDTMMRIVAIESNKLTPPTPADRRFYYFYEGLPTLAQAAGLSRVYLDENGQVPEAILDVFEGYYRDESARILRVRSEVDKVLAGDMSSKDLFERYHYSKYLGRDAKGEGIVDGKQLKSKGKYTGRGANFTHFNGFKLNMTTEEFRNKLRETLTDRLNDTAAKMSELGIITVENNYISNNILSEKHLSKYRELTNDNQRALQSMIANFAFNTMYTNIETGKVFTGDPAAFKNSEDYVKRLPGSTSTGDNLRTEFPSDYYEGERLIQNPTYNITTFSSNEVPSLYYDQLVKMHKDYYLEKGIVNTEEKAEEIAKTKLEGLKSTDQTDAQTYITPEMYRATSIRLGKWSDQKEEAYQLLQSGRELTNEEKVKLSNVVMQPLKMTYMDIIFKNGHAIPVFDKMSMATLFRPMVEGTQLEELLDRMEAKGKYEGYTPIDQVKFHTAEKVGIKDRREFFKDSTESELTDLTELAYYPQKFERLRYQLVTDPHAVSRTLVGSQFKKVGMANLYKEDIYTVEGEGEVFGEDVANAVNEIISELSNRNIEQLYDELGIDKSQMKFTDSELLVARLREEGRKAALPDYLVESFKLDKDGNFYLDVDSFPGNRKWIQNRIISLIKKAAVDLKLPGNVFIQMSDIGLRNIDKSDELKFLDDEGFLEAKISVGLFRSLIPNFSSLTHEQRVEKIKDLGLTSIGYRIPTQGQNSVYMLKIQEFLPESVGDVLVLPKEGPAIGGFDFDIDKMYIIRPNYKRGEKVRYLTDENSTVEERANVYAEEANSEELRKIRSEYSDAIKEVAADIEVYKDSIEVAKEQIAQINEYIEYNYDIEYNIEKLREQRDIKEGNYTLKKDAIERIKQLRKDLEEETKRIKDEWIENNLEEFSARPIIQQNIKTAVENRLLNYYFGVLSNNNHIIRRTTPLGYTSNMMSDLSKQIRKWKGIQEEVTGALEAVSPVYQLDVKSRYKFGKQGLGPFALANVHHVLGQTANISLFKDLGVGNKNAEGLTDLSKILGKDNIDITEWFSGLIDAHVDIAADPYIYYLNVNDLTRDVVTLLVRAGVGGMTTFKFTAQPILSDIASKLDNKGNKLDVNVTNVSEGIRNQYIRRMFDENPNFSPEVFQESMLKDIVNEGNLEFLLTHYNKRDAEWYNKQVLVLDAFRYLNEFAGYLTEATLTSRIDTKKFGSSFSEIVSFKNRIFKSYEDMDKGLGIKNYDKLMEDTYLDALSNNSINVVDQVLSDIILEATPSFYSFVDSILRLTGNYYTLNERTIPSIVDEVYANIYGEFFKEYGLNRKMAAKMLYGEESIAKKINDIRAGKTFPRLKNNRMIRMLEPVYGEDRPDFLAVFKPDNKWYRDDISRAWKEIFNGTQAEKQFAVDLMYYSFLTSGFKGTVNSFHDLIPTEVIKYSGLDEFIKRKQQELNETPDYFNSSIDDFFRNMWTSDDLVPKGNVDTSTSIVTKGVTVAVKSSNTALLRGFNKEGDPVYAPYIKVGKKAPVLMKYIGYDEVSQEAVYVAVDKKGYRKDGFVVRENALDDTLFKSNKLDISDAVKQDLNATNFTNLISKLKGNKKQMYVNFVPMEDSKQVVNKMKDTASSTSSTSMQARAPKVLNLSTKQIEAVNQGGQVTLNDPNLEGTWVLPNNKIVNLENIEGNSYLVSEAGYQAPNNEEVNRRIKEC